MKELLDFRVFLEGLGMNSTNVEVFNAIIVSVILIAVAFMSFFITRLLISRVVKKIIQKTKTDYDDVLIKQRVFDPISHIVPAIIFFIGAKYITTDANVLGFVHKILYSYLAISILIVIFRILNALNDVYEIYAEKKRLTFHIKQYVQVLKIIFGLITIILIVSILIEKQPGAIFAGLGAMTAVLMLVFKDSILSLVASIQISAYKLMKVGDWITVPSRGVDGDVMDISLNTIKIRNFDKTISTIPTYSVVQDSFVNWSGMQETGGRRISRSIFIDVNSVKLCDNEMIEKFKKIHYIADYVKDKQAEIDKWNEDNNVHEPVFVNGRCQTNIGVFRKYVENYLKSNFRVFKKYEKRQFLVDGRFIERYVIDDIVDLKKELGHKVYQFLEEIEDYTVINNVDKFIMYFPQNYKLENGRIYKIKKIIKTVIKKGTEVEVEDFEKIVIQKGLFSDDLTVLVRQLASSDKGLPIQIYVFASTTVWAEYEKIQSNLFDHIFAVLPEFELQVFQQPSSNDFHKFLEAKNS